MKNFVRYSVISVTDEFYVLLIVVVQDLNSFENYDFQPLCFSCKSSEKKIFKGQYKFRKIWKLFSKKVAYPVEKFNSSDNYFVPFTRFKQKSKLVS